MEAVGTCKHSDQPTCDDGKSSQEFKDAGDFNAAIQEWEARPAVLQTYKKLKVVMCAEYSKLNCQDAVSARAIRHA